MKDALKSLLGEKVQSRIRLGLAKDGSGVGAALTALQAKKAMDKRIGSKADRKPKEAAGMGGVAPGPK